MSAELTTAVAKPEMTLPSVWLQTADGSTPQQVEQEVAMFSPFLCHEMQTGTGGSCKNFPISLPERIHSSTLTLIFDYCRFHQVSGRSNKERKSFDEKFIRMDTKKLCELTSAADGLQLKPLVDLTSRALARIIEGKTPEEIRRTFNLPDDLTEEEKLEPLKNVADDPRIRLLNRLYARKRNELNQLKVKEKAKGGDEERVDDRSVDDLLSFINGGGGRAGDSKGAGVRGKNRKKNRRKKAAAAVGSSVAVPRESLESEMEFDDDGDDDDDEDDDDDGYDEIDPALKEKIDREVEDFARRLNSDWPERMQEILSLGGQPPRKLPSTAHSSGRFAWLAHR